LTIFFLFGSWGVFPLAALPSPSYFPNNKKNHNRLDDQVEFVYAAKAKANAMCGRENVLVGIFWNILTVPPQKLQPGCQSEFLSVLLLQEKMRLAFSGTI
jgi:hypothetical protein